MKKVINTQIKQEGINYLIGKAGRNPVIKSI